MKKEEKLILELTLHQRQLQAFNSAATELLFGGATEGGKSHFARVLLISYCLKLKGLQCALIRKKYSDILQNHVEGPTGFKAMLAPLLKLGLVIITKEEIRFETTGSRIYFVHCQDERQFDSAQGIERHILVIDEATQISERLLRFFRGWVRMSKEYKLTLPKEYHNKLPCILYTANPIGASVGYFRRYFVNARPHEAIEKVEGFLRQYMLSRYTDNPSIDEEAHKGRLAGMGDTQLARALDVGDWEALVGDFYPEWDEERHVVSDFTPPDHWFRFRTFDWGTADPACCYYWAVSDGEPFKDESGKERWFPRGALIAYNEWYICDPTDPAKGLRMRNEDMATGIIDRSERDFRLVPTLTDSKPFQDTGGEGIAASFLRAGLNLSRADTSRISGWSQLRSRLIGIQIDTNSPERIPMIFFTSCCKYARDYIPALPRHPSEAKKEDAAEHGESTHSCDCVRYACMAHPVIKDSILPMTEQMQRELKRNRPTVKKILGRDARAYFN